MSSCSIPPLSSITSFDKEHQGEKKTKSDQNKTPSVGNMMQLKVPSFFRNSMAPTLPSVVVMCSSVKDLFRDGGKRWKKRSKTKQRKKSTTSENSIVETPTGKQRKPSSSNGASSSTSTASSSLSSPSAIKNTDVNGKNPWNAWKKPTPTPKAYFESVLDQPYPLFFDIDDLFTSYIPEWDYSQRGRMVHHLIQFLELKVSMEEYSPAARDSLLAPTPLVNKAWRVLVTETDLYQQVIGSIQDFHGRPRQMVHYSVMRRRSKRRHQQRPRKQESRDKKKRNSKNKENMKKTSNRYGGTNVFDSNNSRLYRTQALYQVYFQEQMPEGRDEVIVVNNGYGIEYEGIEVKKSETMSSHDESSTASAPDDELSADMQSLQQKQQQQQRKQQSQDPEHKPYQSKFRFRTAMTNSTAEVELRHQAMQPQEVSEKDNISIASDASNLFGLNWA